MGEPGIIAELPSDPVGILRLTAKASLPDGSRAIPVLKVSVNEAPLAIREIPRPKVILRKKARNRGDWVLCLTACHLYPSSFLNLGGYSGSHFRSIRSQFLNGRHPQDCLYCGPGISKAQGEIQCAFKIAHDALNGDRS
jgi:hypothetical protein